MKMNLILRFSSASSEQSSASNPDIVRSMSQHSKLARTPMPVSLRQWVAVFAIFLGLVAQTFHTHKVSFASAKADHHAYLTTPDQSADSCQLCVAMHSALPTQATVPVAFPLVAEVLLVPTMERVRRLPFADFYFSRPPPVSSR